MKSMLSTSLLIKESWRKASPDYFIDGAGAEKTEWGQLWPRKPSNPERRVGPQSPVCRRYGLPQPNPDGGGGGGDIY